jgi:membrane dipeptidase
MPTRRDFLKTSAGLPLVAAGGSLNVIVPRAKGASVLSPPNEKIAGARNVALSILKATPEQIEHGMELHAQSLVFESYGFSPYCAIDAQVLNDAYDAGAPDDELVTLRNEMRMNHCATNAREREEYLQAFRAAGVTCVFQNAGEEGNDPLRLLERVAWYTFTTDMLRDELFKAVSSADVIQAKKDGKLCLCLTTCGVPLRQQWQSTRDELRIIRLFHRLGVRMMHLTYNRRNPIGDGCGESNDGGLSAFGHEAVTEMNRLGVIVDVAHCGWRTSLEAAKASAKPMVASHTTCAALYRHFRAKPDDVIRAICDTGGLVGICCVPRFLGGDGDISTFLNHIDYAVQKFGDDHVAIGTDVAYTSRNASAQSAKVRTGKKEDARRTPARWEALWPRDEYLAKPHGILSLAWTNWPLFTVGMVQRGYSDQTIQKILGGNVLRVLQANSQ